MSRTALITGASAGLGEDFAKLFAADEHNLVLVARREERLRELADKLSERHGVTCHVIPTDLADAAARDALWESIESQGIEVDFLVNNAGFGSNGEFWTLDRERELNQMRVNMEALTDLTHRVLPGMVERKFGRVLNIASTAGFQPGPYMSVYYATKAFVLSFTEGIAHELDGTGVTATAHCPGATATEFAETAGNDESVLFQKNSVAESMDVAKHAYRAMHSGTVVTVHGGMNKLAAASVRFTPRGMLRSIVAKINQAP